MCATIMARDWISIIIIALGVSSFCSSEAQSPTVNFSNVSVQGVGRKTRKGRDVDAFMGIPYAEPPVGDLRFRDPLPKVYSDGTFLANKTQISCLQSLGSSIGEEDCLYLNVYRPTSRRWRLLPVMVYVHGGGFILGNVDVAHTGPDYLLDKDIILVTLTYRLGVFGFLSTGDEVATGNFGLKDQKLAFEWIQRNIAAFGGNPNQVTLFGQSAGAGSIHFHAIVDHTEGLFHRYILESGTATAPWSVRDSKTYPELTKKLANLNECPTRSSLEMVDCLRKVDSMHLLDLSISQFSLTEIYLARLWGPTKEPDVPGAFLTEYPEDLIARFKQRDLPFIAGVTENEGLLITTALLGNSTFYDTIIKDFRKLLNLSLGSSDLVERVIRFYFNGSVSEDKDTFLEQLRDFMSDFFFFHPQVKMLTERREKLKKPFYFYNFNYRGTFSLTSWDLRDNRNVGVTHADELLYLFYHDKSMFPVEGNLTMNQDDYRIVDTMVDLWTSFATQGVPRSRNVESWKPYNSQCQYLQIGNNKDPKTFLKSQFHVERMRFWSNDTRVGCD